MLFQITPAPVRDAWGWTGIHVDKEKECIAVWFGSVPYSHALDLQMRVCELKKRGYARDVLLLLEHPPTITLGRNARDNNLLVGEDHLRKLGVGLWNVDRGGDITFHGPGQLVGYPIVLLRAGERDVHAYMRNLEESLIRLLAGYGIDAMRDSRFTGVWTGSGKIAAMGVHLSRWITRHGFALNVTTDLSFYNLIVPCGIVGKGVTSMERQLPCPPRVDQVAERYIQEFGGIFGRAMITMNELELIDELELFEKSVCSVTVPAL